MPTLSQAQIQMYAQSAGLSADRARIAAAIAMAESGGRTDAHNATPPDDSYGLWQINMLGPLGPARRAKLGISSNTALYDPATNARAMAMISNRGASFGPWSTYTNGAYKKHLGGAAGTADPAIDLNDLNDFGTGLLPFGTGINGVGAIAQLGVGAAEWMANPHNWVRVVLVGTGAILVGVGLAVMTRGAWEPVQQAAKKAASLTPTGGAAKAATAAKTAPKAAAKPKPKPTPAPEAA